MTDKEQRARRIQAAVRRLMVWQIDRLGAPEIPDFGVVQAACFEPESRTLRIEFAENQYFGVRLQAFKDLN